VGFVAVLRLFPAIYTQFSAMNFRKAIKHSACCIAKTHCQTHDELERNQSKRSERIRSIHTPCGWLNVTLNLDSFYFIFIIILDISFILLPHTAFFILFLRELLQASQPAL
jgi:hypothetical protein